MSAEKSAIDARQKLLSAALDVLRAERMLHVTAPAMTKLKTAEDAMDLAARDLTNAVDDLPPVQRPKGWALSEDGETA